MKEGYDVNKNSVIAGIAAIVLLSLVASSATGCTCIKTAKQIATRSGGNVVAINAQDANNVGSLEFELVYDPSMLTVVKVTKGKLADNAMLDYSLDRPGQVWVAMVDSNGISGNGSLVTVSFKTVGQGAADSQLTIKNIRAYDAEKLVDIITQATAGTTGKAPVITFVR